jgi:hypothetical protein
VRRVEVTAYCFDDIEAAEGKEVDATGHQIVIDGDGYLIDLSEENGDRYLGPLLEVLKNHGRPLVQTADTGGSRRRGPVLKQDARGRHLCPHQKCASKPGFGRQRAVFEHARLTHGAEYYMSLVDQYSTLSPEDRQCRHCDKNDFFGPSGKRAHERTLHGQ